jgi:hypothetical protein
VFEEKRSSLFRLTAGDENRFVTTSPDVSVVEAVAVVVADALPFLTLEVLTLPPLLPRSRLALALIKLSIAPTVRSRSRNREDDVSKYPFGHCPPNFGSTCSFSAKFVAFFRHKNLKKKKVFFFSLQIVQILLMSV